MKFFPREHYFLQTKLSPGEILKRVQVKTDTLQNIISFSKSKTGLPFRGMVLNSGFKITRAVSSRGSLAPVIKGSIINTGYGAEIEIRMRMIITNYIFFSMWFGITGIVSVYGIVMQIKSAVFEPGILLPLGMFGFVYLYLFFGVMNETETAKKFLTSLLEAEEIKK